jgi:hypothetical protein
MEISTIFLIGCWMECGVTGLGGGPQGGKKELL